MKRSQRGAAKISVVWAICLFMAFAAAAAAYFLSNQQAAETQARYDTAEAARKKAVAEVDELKVYVSGITQKAGFSDPQQTSRMDSGALDAGLKDLKDNIPGIDATVTNLQKALPLAIQAYKHEKTRADEADARATQLTSENETIRANVAQVSSEKTKEIEDVRRQLSDAETSFNDQKGEYERRIAELSERVRTIDGEKLQLVAQVEELKRKSALENDAWLARMSEAERKLTPFMKEPESADGRVLAISPELRLGWINVGTQHRLSKGTRFRVIDGLAGSKKLKAWCEVVQVDKDMAQVAFSDQVDPFDPPVVGDVVYNPLFDPSGERSAVMIGRFSGAMGEESLKALLKSMNISVTRGLEKTTDFLIVGGEMYTDPENGTPLETPMLPSDMPIYKAAQAEGVQVVALKELRQYFRTN